MVGSPELTPIKTPDEILGDFLFNPLFHEPSDEVRNELTPELFLNLLTDSVDRYVEDDLQVVEAIRRFGLNSVVEFKEPETPDDEFTGYANRVEVSISSFIESNFSVATFELLDEISLNQLMEIYNPNNLLDFTRDLIINRSDSFGFKEVDMIYRYKNILRCLAVRQSEISSLKDHETNPLPSEPKDGARTWAGYIHPYGHRDGGKIDLSDFNSFSEREDPGHDVIHVDGVPIKVRNDGYGPNPTTY